MRLKLKKWMGAIVLCAFLINMLGSNGLVWANPTSATETEWTEVSEPQDQPNGLPTEQPASQPDASLDAASSEDASAASTLSRPNEAQPLANGERAAIPPNTVGISVYKKGISTPISDADLQKLPMLDIDGGQVSVQMVPSLGETGTSTYKVVLPDYYSFQGVSPSGSNYTSAVVSSDTSTNPNAKDNVLTITIPAPSNPQQPSQVSLSFNTVLNRNSIPKDKQDAWEAGTWHPNDQGTTYRITKPSDPNVKSEKNVKFLYTVPDNVAPSMNAIHEDGSGKDWGERWGLDANGIPGGLYANDMDGTRLPHVNFVLHTSDLWVSGPKSIKQIVVKAPDDMFFTGKFPSGCTVTLSPDKKTATITDITAQANDKGVLDLKRLELSPNPEYLNKENPFAKRFEPNTVLPITAHVEYNDGTNYDINKQFKVANYELAETARVFAEPGYTETGKKYETFNGKTVYDIVNAGVKGRVTNGWAFYTERPNYLKEGRDNKNTLEGLKTPKDMGEDMKNVLVFGDPAEPTKYIQLKSFNVYNPGYNSNEQGLSQQTLKEIRYYTVKHPEGIVISNPATGSVTVKVEDPTDAITKAELIYKRFIFVGTGNPATASNLVSSFNYDTSAITESKVLVPVTSTIYDPQGTELSKAENNILVRMGRDPQFGMFGTEGVTKSLNRFMPADPFKPSTYVKPGTYADEKEYLNYTIGIHDEKVGADVGILDKLDNIWFNNLGPYTTGDSTSTAVGHYFTNGHVALHKIMNDGKWTVEVRTISADEWAKNPTKKAVASAAQTFKIPAFSEDKYDLRLDQLIGGLKPGQMITNFVFKHDGALDISSFNEAGADRAFYDVYMDNLSHHPVLGTAFYGLLPRKGYSDSYDRTTQNDFVHVKIDNTAEFDEKHSEAKYLNKSNRISPNGQDRVLKGADMAAPVKVAGDSAGSVLRQGGTTTVKMAVTYSSSLSSNTVNPNSRVSVQDGWTAYLQLNPDTLKYTTPVAGSAKIEGVVDPNSKIVEIGGKKYLKVTYSGPAVEKAPTGNSSGTYQPINIEWDSYSLPSTPVTQPLTVIDGGYLDVSSKQEWTYEKDGVVYKTGIDSSGNGTRFLLWALDSPLRASFNDFVNGKVVKDDPLKLHSDRPAYERAFAMMLPKLEILPNKDVLTGLTLIPGIEGEGFQQNEQPVASNQEGKERVLISLIAGDADLTNVSTTMKLPRAGENATSGGQPVKQEVSQYLTGPVTSYQDPGNSASTKMLVKYSLDGGKTFVDESAVTDWSQVTDLQITDEVLKANDSNVLLIPLTTEHKKNNDGKVSVGKAYWNAIARIGEGGAETTRELLFSYKGHDISGAVWVDSDKDGNQNNGETLYTAKPVEVKLMKGDEVLQTTYTTKDGTAQGEPTGLYSFKAVEAHEDVRVVLTLPDNYGITKEPAQGVKNKFSVAEPATAVLTSPLADKVENVDAGIAITPKAVTHIDAKKVLDGRAFKTGDSFTFTLAAVTENAPMPDENGERITVTNGDVKSFGDITFKQPGSYTYTVTETVPEDAVNNVKDGITYDTVAKQVTIEVTAGDGGALSAAITYPENADAATFTNKYKATGVTIGGGEPGSETAEKGINVQKLLTGREWTDADEFTFTLEPQNGAPAFAQTSVKATKDAQKVGFGAATFETAGTYTYLIKETVPADASNNVKDGITYDTQTITATVKVEDDTNGKLVATTTYSTGAAVAEFTNTYGASAATVTGDSGIKAQKVLDGRAFKAGDSFEFKLEAVTENAPMPAAGGETISVTDGTAKAFGAISYTTAGTYTYKVKETKGSVAGVTYDESQKEVTVTVTDNGTGVLSAAIAYPENADAATFTNKYKATGVTIGGGEPGSETAEKGINVQKVLTGREWTDADEFTFTLEPQNGAPAFAQTSVKATKDAQKVGFGAATFETAGTYTYLIKETVPADASNNVKDGITYDTQTITATVTVTDDQDGKLVANTTYSTNGAVAEFTNKYGASAATVTGDSGIKAKKVLEGRAFKAGDSFEFKLVAVTENAPMPAAGGETISVTDGTAKAFGAISYTTAGTYTYKVKETAGTLAGVTYDTAEKKVTVTVTDNGTGVLSAAIAYPENADAATFTNKYKATGVTIGGGNGGDGNTDPNAANKGIQVQKTISGRDWKDGDAFTFTLTAQNDAPAFSETEVTVKDGKPVGFGKATFESAGTYTYELAEKKGDIAGMTYDTSKIIATVTVTDDTNGKLVATVTYSTGSAVAEFVNKYESSNPGYVAPLVPPKQKNPNDPQTGKPGSGTNGKDPVPATGESGDWASIFFGSSLILALGAAVTVRRRRTHRG